MSAPRPPDERRQLSVILGVALGCMALMIVLPAFIIAVFGRPQPVPAPALEATSPATSQAWPTQLDPDAPTGTALAPSAKLATADDGKGWLGVAASPGLAPVLAVWTPSQLFVSRDDGRSFRQILGGPGRIGGAAVDSDGWVFMVRDRRRLGFQNPGAGSPGVWWRDLPFAGETLQLVTGGHWLGWLALAEDSENGSQVVLAISDDGGVTWRTQSITDHADDALMRIENDGTIHLVLLREDAANPTMWRLRGHVDGRPMHRMPWPSDYTEAWGLGHGGFAYAIASECASEGNDICAVELHDQFVSTRLTTEWNLQMGSNGMTTLAASGSQLLRFDGHVAAVVDEHAPEGITVLTVDGQGRGVGVVGQHLIRWSPRHGWRVLFTPNGQIHYATP